MQKLKGLLMVCVAVLSIFYGAQTSYADASYDTGYAVGSLLGQGLFGGAPGRSEKDFYKLEGYDFTKIKRILIIVDKNDLKYVSDRYIDVKYPEIMRKAFAEKNVIVKSYEEALSEARGTLGPEPTKTQILDYLYRIFDVYGSVRIIAYYQTGSIGHVWLEYELKDMKTKALIMHYKDMRLDAPRSWKEGMIKRITNAFYDRFEDAWDEAAEKRGKN